MVLSLLLHVADLLKFALPPQKCLITFYATTCYQNTRLKTYYAKTSSEVFLDTLIKPLSDFGTYFNKIVSAYMTCNWTVIPADTYVWWYSTALSDFFASYFFPLT